MSDEVVTFVDDADGYRRWIYGHPDDLAVLDAYVRRVPLSTLPIVRALFELTCEAITRRWLRWKAYREGEAVGFKEGAAGSFKVAIHLSRRRARPEAYVFEPPSLLIHPRLPLAELGESDPFRGYLVLGGEVLGSGLEHLLGRAGSRYRTRRRPRSEVRTSVRA
jgi:hypothetical protein